MAGSFVSNLVHYVWSTSGRRAWINESWQDRLYGYIGGIVRNKKGRLLCAGGMPDHVHLYVSLPATVSLAEIANVLKSNSSAWVHENIPGKKNFRWQSGYGAFTVSKSAEDRLMRYIKNQKEHHRQRTFQEEFLALLKKHGIEYDVKFIWE